MCIASILASFPREGCSRGHPAEFSHISAGCYAEYVSTKESYLAHQPAALSSEEAAGVPLAALTAYQVRPVSLFSKEQMLLEKANRRHSDVTHLLLASMLHCNS